MKGPEHIPIQQKEGLQNPSRRRFIKKAIQTGLGVGATASLVPGVLEMLSKDEPQEENREEEEKKERIPPVVITPLEQLAAYGEIRDLKKGVEALYSDHYRYLTTTGKGKEDMRRAVKNLSHLDLKKMARPFKERGLPLELAYMIAIQETRARNTTSWAGARGLTGIMPKTAKAHGYDPDDAYNPYIASEITARYLETEKEDRFGDDIDLLLYSYNAGGGLFGYTKTVPEKKERTVEGFYEYMEDYFNTRYNEVKEKGYYEYTIRSGDTLLRISRFFRVPLEDILEKNGLTMESVIHEGDILKVPFTDMQDFVKVIFRKPLEAIRYTPELKAKYKAMKDRGFTERIELAMNEGNRG